MDRGSNKHSPRVDEELGHEAEGMMRAERPTRAQEWKEPEPAGEDQPDPGALGEPAHRQPAPPPGMTVTEVALRSELGARLTRAAFPNDVSGLLGHLVDTDAPDRLRQLVRQLPSGRVFENVGEVFQALGFHQEDHRF
ncbi:MAG: DUF2795 domain-containing protein [Mycobacteriales bacterium]